MRRTGLRGRAAPRLWRRWTNSTLSAFIRGVGQQAPVGGFEAGVGLYLDDVKDFQIFVDSWDRLRGAALERHDTRQFLKELSEVYRSQMNV